MSHTSNKVDSMSPNIVPTRIGGSLLLDFEHLDYKDSSLFRRPNRMQIKINLTEIKTDLKLILKSTKKTTTLV